LTTAAANLFFLGCEERQMIMIWHYVNANANEERAHDDEQRGTRPDLPCALRRAALAGRWKLKAGNLLLLLP
jgi:hypothetical protein